MNKTKIEWADYTWNPIKGLCPVDCKLPDGKSYCYARKMYKRFGWNPRLGFNDDELWKPSGIKKPSRIFVCPTFELFHSSTGEEIHIERDPVCEDAFFGKSQRDWIFHVIEDNPQHTFQILTKLPRNIDREMPDNVWLGVSIMKEKDMWRYLEIRKIPAKILFVSYEPLIGKIESNPPAADWIIIGRLTGHGNKYNPKKEWIQHIINRAKGWKEPQPIFLKNNLKPIWGGNLIQEFPE